MNSKRKRPIGVTLIALAFLWIGCDGALFLPIIGLTGGTYGIWQLAFGSTIHSEAWLKIVAHVLDCIWWALYVAYAVIGFGLWKLKSWARKSVLAIAAIAAFGATVAFAVSLVMVRPVSLGVAVFGFALAQFGWLAWYLMRPRVRHAFGAWNLHCSTGDWIEPPGLSKRARAGVGILGAISVAVLFVVPLYFAINKEMRDSDAYKLTMNMAQASPCVVNVLGTLSNRVG